MNCYVLVRGVAIAILTTVALLSYPHVSQMSWWIAALLLFAAALVKPITYRPEVTPILIGLGVGAFHLAAWEEIVPMSYVAAIGIASVIAAAHLVIRNQAEKLRKELEQETGADLSSAD